RRQVELTRERYPHHAQLVQLALQRRGHVVVVDYQDLVVRVRAFRPDAADDVADDRRLPAADPRRPARARNHDADLRPALDAVADALQARAWPWPHDAGPADGL